jgi:uncharacterized protein YlzI (FlbEa/FlbD family)
VKRAEYKTMVVMDNGKVYGFTEPIDQFLKRVYDTRTARIIPTLLKGEGFYINTEHIASIEEVENCVMENKLSTDEMDQISLELRKLIAEDIE